MRVLISLFLFCFSISTFALQSINGIEKYKPKNYGTPCVQALLNKEPLNSGSFLTKNTKGILTVTKDNKTKILFNITLKSNIGKKDEPPVYLRFIKQKQLNISEILEYAEEGDEIYIEEFVPSLNKVDLSCSPASITVIENL
ncbi:MAG TPA: hypothetical protein PLS10_01220 [Chitinophagales bacterium]|jgi:hypothetical protein|nr:hypothetical protein [Chitinophagales bacterium]